MSLPAESLAKAGPTATSAVPARSRMRVDCRNRDLAVASFGAPLDFSPARRSHDRALDPEAIDADAWDNEISMDTQILRREFSVDEFHRMAEAGVFGEGDRLELLDGEIVCMTPIGSRHAGCVNRLTSLLTAAVGTDAVVSVQNPVVCGDRTELQPDLAILKPRADFYSRTHPRPPDVYAVIEVADSSIGYDQGVKMAAYATAGIEALLIIDLGAKKVAVYRTPAGGTFRQHDVLRADDRLQVPGAAATKMRVGDFFD